MISKDTIEKSAKAILLARLGAGAEAMFQPIPDDFPTPDAARHIFDKRIAEARIEARAALEAAFSDVEAVRYQRQTKDGWLEVDAEDIPHYRGRGQDVRGLYTAPPMQVQDAAKLPQDVIDLVISAREFWDEANDWSVESFALDDALKAFASRVPFENEPEAPIKIEGAA